jgi:1-deoxy-D-xylulose-5-phosphate synthase
VFGKSLLAEAKEDNRVVAVTAAMPSGTGVDILAKEFPRRVYDVGIAEQHAVTFAAGLAATGMKPFCAIYSTFLQRAYDQIVHDVALQNLPVRFAIDRAGLVGADGPTHGGILDISYMANMPNMTVMAASDEAELAHMVRTAADYDEGPICFRYPRGTGPGVSVPTRGERLAIGKGRVVKDGTDLAILSFGAHLGVALEAAQLLEQQGISVTVADARFAKPLDTELVDRLVASHSAVLTLEQGAMGGFGAIVLQHLTLTGQLADGINIDTVFLPDRFIDQGSPDDMYHDAEMSLSHVFERCIKVLQRSDARQTAYTKQHVNNN